MTLGIPVISTTTGGTPEYVKDGKTGILVEPNNSVQLADAILRLFDNEKLRRNMGESAYKRAVGLFSYERMTDNLLELNRELCNN